MNWDQVHNMTKKIIAVGGMALLALAVQVAPATAQTNVAGTWTLTLEGPEGPVESTIVLTQNGSEVTGTIVMDQVDAAELTGGVIEGNTLKFVLAISVQGMDIALEATGEVSGDAMEGELYVPDFGGFPFSAVRTES
jgi:hypothetical protein